MTKVKKIIAAAVAAVSMGALGVTAFADFGNYSFVLEGLHWDNYVDVSSGVEKSADWSTDASITVTAGNLSYTNYADIMITADDSWPEDYIVSKGEVSVKNDNNAKYKVQYDINSPNIDDVENNTVYLVARTGCEDVYFSGFWTP